MYKLYLHQWLKQYIYRGFSTFGQSSTVTQGTLTTISNKKILLLKDDKILCKKKLSKYKKVWKMAYDVLSFQQEIEKEI